MALMLDNCESILLSLDSPHGHHKSSSVPAPFLIKTYQLVDDPTTDHIVSWGDDHTTFVVWRPSDFVRDLLPNYFKHNKFSSFIRQLNTYGFRKIVPDRWEFANEFFRKGEKHLLCEIHRRNTSHPSQLAATNHHHQQYPHSPCCPAFYPYSTQISISPPKIQIQQVQISDSLTPGVTLQSIMKTSSLPNLNHETTSSPTFFSLFQDPDHHDDTTLNKRPKIDNSQYTEASDTSPLKVASAHINNNNNNDHRRSRALDADSALMDDAQSCCGSNSYGGDVEECSLGSSRSRYSVADDGNTSIRIAGNVASTSRIGSSSWVHQSFGDPPCPGSHAQGRGLVI